MIRRCIAGALVSLAILGLSRADFVIFNYGGRALALQGTFTIQGRLVQYQHPTLSKTLVFPYDPSQVRLLKTLSPQQQYNRLKAKAGQDADGVFQAGIWALKKGQIKHFDDAVEATLKIDPNHALAKRMIEFRKQMDAEIPDDPKLEQELKSLAPRGSFEIARGKHFILLHDTPPKPAPGQKKNLSAKRLELLEQTYESFLLLFAAQGVDIQVPKQRMKAILFSDFRDFRDKSDELSPALASPSGFWEPERNVSIFLANSVTPIQKFLTTLHTDFKKQADDAKKARSPVQGELNRTVNTLELLLDMDRENTDIAVVSHEAAHQLAGNTLFSRNVIVPNWVREGLATYFEIPADANWAGIGAVNEQRLSLYRDLESDREHSNIDFIVGDQIFDYTNQIGSPLHGRAQAWALTHFLMENRIKEFVKFYEQLGDMPPDVRLNPDLLTQLFTEQFGADRQSLDQDWRAYMRTLRTDLELLEDQTSASN